MAIEVLACPQCSAPLPRVALWRSVKCPSCGSLVTRSVRTVRRDGFAEALKRSRLATEAPTGRQIACGSDRYALLELMDRGSAFEVHLARRLGPQPLLVMVKLALDASAADSLTREAENLRRLQALDGPAAVYAARRLPAVIACTPVDDGSGRRALVLRQPSGFWGTLAALSARFPQGIDPRHAVWIWRRLLDGLHFIHAEGWIHGSVRPEHALVHPQDHGVCLIGWAAARKNAEPNAQAADLMSAARVVQVLLVGSIDSGTLPGGVPAGLGSLVTRAAQDGEFCIEQGASGLDALLLSAARDAFGDPAFVPLVL